jgi:hypothetical protein
MGPLSEWRIEVGKKILYGKVGRSVPMTIEKSSSLGGDIEFYATLKLLAERNPEDEFIIIGRNSGEKPQHIGLPVNVTNPWEWLTERVKADITKYNLRYASLSVEDQLFLAKIIDRHTLEYFLNADEIIMWAGQHGTTSTPMPGIKDRSVLTKPQDSSALYAGFLLRGINAWRDLDPIKNDEVWLNADPRNYLKLRDLKWPLRYPVLCQYNFTNNIKHERAGDASLFSLFHVPGEIDVADGVSVGDVWKAKVKNEYARLELNGMMPGTPFHDLLTFNNESDGRGRFGIIVNETRVAGVHPAKGRKAALRDYVLPLEPDFIHGTWSQDSRIELGINPTPLAYEHYVKRLQSVRSTFTTPASGSGWATAKPWESFGAGTICFFHPAYDDQDNILADAPASLRAYLRVSKPSELASKVREVNEDSQYWRWIVDMQRQHFEKAVAEMTFITRIEERIYG